MICTFLLLSLVLWHLLILWLFNLVSRLPWFLSISAWQHSILGHHRLLLPLLRGNLWKPGLGSPTDFYLPTNPPNQTCWLQVPGRTLPHLASSWVSPPEEILSTSTLHPPPNHSFWSILCVLFFLIASRFSPSVFLIENRYKYHWCSFVAIITI